MKDKKTRLFPFVSGTVLMLPKHSQSDKADGVTTLVAVLIVTALVIAIL